MKKLILLGLATVLFMACQEKGPERFTTTSPNIDVVKALVKDYEEGNWDAWLSHYSSDAKVQHNEFKFSPKELQDALKADITEFAKQKCSPYEVPKMIEIVKELPLTTVGKVDKKVLRK